MTKKAPSPKSPRAGGGAAAGGGGGGGGLALRGSCRCGAVAFSCRSHAPAPYQRCYCSVCRKTAGGGGYSVNILAEAATLRLAPGAEAALRRFNALLPAGGGGGGGAEEGGRLEPSAHTRFYCGECGCHVYARHPAWPRWVYPVAAAIDTPLPAPAHVAHIMLGSKAAWVVPAVAEGDATFEGYPELSIEEWHKQNGQWVD